MKCLKLKLTNEVKELYTKNSKAFMKEIKDNINK